MKTAKLLKKILVNLPSVVMAVIFIQYGLTKVFNSGQLDTVIKNQTGLIIVASIFVACLRNSELFYQDKLHIQNH